MKSRAERIMPLDRDETVMISPTEARLSTTDERPAKRKARPAQNARDVTSAGAHQPPPTPARVKDAEETSRRGIDSRLTEPAVEEVRLVDPARPESDSVRVEPTTAFSENKGDTVSPEAGNKTHRPVNTEKRQTDTASSETPDKDFFERTSEILQGREAEPSAVQTILIQEVQEWIAAGRIPTDDIMTHVDADREPQQPEEPHLIIERKPGVVRIGDRKPPDISSDNVQESTASSAERINEQNFEISIGSISVVVEGDEPVPQPAPAATQQRGPTRSASPRTSRLSRHYL